MLADLLFPNTLFSAAAVGSILSPEDAKAGKWRGQNARDTGRIDALSFLQHWGRTSKRKSEDLTKSVAFLWGFYILQLDTDADVIGPGIFKFFIAEIPNVFHPDCRTHSLVEFIVWRSDTSQVRIQPRSSQGLRMLFVDRPSPNYYGHLARQNLPGNILGPRAPTGVIADGQGLKGLYDTVTNAEASAALERLPVGLGLDSEVNLSDGIRFPWPLWIHCQPEIMEVVIPNTGVTKFSAIAFSFLHGRSQRCYTTRAFCIDLQHPGDSLLMFPFPSRVFSLRFDRTRDSPSSCCANHPKLRDLMYSNINRPLPARCYKVPWGVGRGYER